MDRRKYRYATAYMPVEESVLPGEGMSSEQAAKQSAYYILAQRINEEFAPNESITLEKIYDYVTRDFGLSKYESDDVIKRAIAAGYIRKGKVRI